MSKKVVTMKKIDDIPQGGLQFDRERSMKKIRSQKNIGYSIEKENGRLPPQQQQYQGMVDRLKVKNS